MSRVKKCPRTRVVVPYSVSGSCNQVYCFQSFLCGTKAKPCDRIEHLTGNLISQKKKHNPAAIGILAAVYFLAGKLGLTMAFVHPSATAVWPPAGIALAALLILGYEVWPGILLGAFLVNLVTAGSVATSIGIATGNTLEALAGAYLVTKLAGGRKAFDREQDTIKFAVLAGILSTTIAATFGVTSLCLGGFAKWTSYGAVWSTWWLGDAVGDVIVAPLLILWSAAPRLRWNRSQFLEALALLACLIVVGRIVFAGFLLPGTSNYPLEYLCIPVLIWASYRFGQREAATATLVLSAMAIWGTLHGLGPFVRQTENESLLLLQAFMGVVAVMTLGLAAVFAVRQRAVEQARSLAVSDPLTGLANYRKLVDELDVEIKRYGRTGRSFAILLLDLDGLKAINDTHGHLSGNRALCRLAHVLRIHCRDIDTAARHGGDEFALILPEADRDAARQVAQRISDGLVDDGEWPALSVSIGAAICPEDGETIETLLTAADHDLYQMKRR
jgi:diguanylate cyclase (GGDEF)-like protein